MDLRWYLRNATHALYIATALEAARPTRDAASAPRDEGADEPFAAGPTGGAEEAPKGEPTAAEIARFRQLQSAVRREEAIEKNKMRINAALDTLPVNLTATEREGVHRAYAAFQPRVSEIWQEVKVEAQATIAAGGQVDRATVMAEATTTIQQEFAGALSSVVGAADAETISGALMARGK